jgi:tripartite-type tricarboxylate transporter receptor subunit TctC
MASNRNVGRAGKTMRTFWVAIILGLMAATPAPAQPKDEAAGFPSRTVKIIVSAPPGGGLDIAARLMADKLQQRWGQAVVVENRPGAGGNLGAGEVAGAEPDGYTLLCAQPAPLTTNVLLYKNLHFDPAALEPVILMTMLPNVLVVRADFPANTVGELIAYAKANPGKITMASAGIGSTGHLVGEFFKMTAGVDFVHVPYRGAGPALTDLVGGQVLISFAGIAGSIEHVRSGKLRALAITTAARSDALPDVPTVSEFLPGFEAGDWLGVGAPKNTPTEIIDRLNKEITAGVADPKIKARFADLGGTPLALTPAEFGKLLADETAKWAKVIRAANIKPE